MSRAKTVTPVDEDPAETGAVNANSAETAPGGEPATETGHAPAAAESEATEPTTAEGEEAEPVPAEDDATEPEAAEARLTTTAEGDATEPQPEAAEAAEGEAAEGEATEPTKPRPAWRRLPALLLAAALVLTGAGVWFTLEARSAAANPAAANLALTDVGATADVTSAVTLAVNRIFSYSYDRTDVTEKAAAAVLRGAAKDSYDKLFAEVRQKAPEQKLVLTSRVSAIAVQELKNGHARLLVFLDQSAVRADNNATDTAAAQLSVTAEHTAGGWVITELEAR